MSTTGKMSGLDAYRGERLYMRTPLHENTFTDKHLYTRTLLQTNIFTHEHFYSYTHLQTNTFIAKNIYSQNNLQSNTFTVEIFTVQCITDTGILLQVIKCYRSFYAPVISLRISPNVIITIRASKRTIPAR